VKYAKIWRVTIQTSASEVKNIASANNIEGARLIQCCQEVNIGRHMHYTADATDQAIPHGLIKTQPRFCDVALDEMNAPLSG